MRSLSWLHSMKTGVSLLAAVIVVAAFGSLVPAQLPSAAAQQRLEAFGLQDLYHGFVFRALLGLLCLNTLLCSLRRAPGIWQTVRQPPSSFLEPPSSAACTALSAAKTPEVFARLKRRGFQLTEQSHTANSWLARRGRYSACGALTAHLSLFFIAGGALLGNLYGSDSQLQLAVGESGRIADAAYRIRLDDFQTAYYPDGSVSDWTSSVTLSQPDGTEIRQDITVNHPLSLNGWRIYQQSHSRRIHAQLRTPSTPPESVALEEEAVLALPNSGALLQPVRYLPDFDPAQPALTRSNESRNPHILYRYQRIGQAPLWNVAPLRQAVALDDGSTLTFASVETVSGLQVKHDPGLPFVWFGFALLLTGVLIALHPPRQTVWLRENRLYALNNRFPSHSQRLLDELTATR